MGTTQNPIPNGNGTSIHVDVEGAVKRTWLYKSEVFYIEIQQEQCRTKFQIGMIPLQVESACMYICHPQDLELKIPIKLNQKLQYSTCVRGRLHLALEERTH